MIPDQARKELEALFHPPPDGGPLLGILRSDLTIAFRDLNARRILKRAYDDLVAPGNREVQTEGPAVCLRSSSPGEIDPSAVPDRLPAACIPAEARTEGWFADHAFRTARVHDEVRRLRAALGRRSSQAAPCIGRAVNLVIERTADPGRIDDHLQDAIARVLKQAGHYVCGRDFCPWFLEILSHCIADVYRSKGPPIDPARDPAWEAARPAVDEHAVLVGEWYEAAIEGFVKHGIPIPPEWYVAPARLELEGLGIKDPPEPIVFRRAEYLRRCFEEAVGRGRPGGVPMRLYELYVAYGTHRDLRKEIDVGDPAAAGLADVERGIEALIVYIEKKERGGASWPVSPDGPAGPVDQLARVQVQAWGLLAGRKETDVIWKAARNLHWFSWRLKAAATLAAALRYARRRDDPSLGRVVEALRSLDCVRTFPEEVGEVVSPFLAIVDGLPAAGHADAEAVESLLRSALERAGLASTARRAIRIDDELPDVDWGWWVSRVTGRGRDHADGLARRLRGSDGVGPRSHDRS